MANEFLDQLLQNEPNEMETDEIKELRERQAKIQRDISTLQEGLTKIKDALSKL